MKVTWLWGPLYWGIEFAWDYDRGRGVFIGWHSRYWRARGW